MKKILSIIIFVLFMFPAVVKADMGAPEIKPYEMVVIAPEGIDYYDYNHEKKGHLDIDTKFKVTFEYDGEYEISVLNDERGTIYTTEGAALVKEEFDPSESDNDGYVVKEKGKAIVYTKDGVDLLKGPSRAYSKVKGGHIDEDEVVTYTYSISGGTYIYAEYNGKKGWLDISDKKVLIESGEYYIFRIDQEVSGITIPKNTILKAKYATDAWSFSHLFEYDGKDVLVNTFKSDDVLNIKGIKATANKELKVYEYSNNSGKQITTIPKGAEFIYYASTFSYGEEEDQIYAEYEGKRGWILSTYEGYEADWQKEVPFKLDDEKEEKEEEPEKEEKTEKKKTKKSKYTSDEYVLMYVIIGGAVALGGLIIIILVNKNKKLKKQLVEAQTKETSVEKENVVEEQDNDSQE